MRKLHILYLLNQFPVLSELFVLNEITGLIDLGHNVYIISINRPHEKKVHNNVKSYSLMNKTTYLESMPYSYKQILKAAIAALFTDRTLLIKEKFQLLKLCYDNDMDGLGVKLFLSCLAIIKIIKDKGINHIHCHFAYKNVQWAYLIHQVLKIPYTFTTHANDIFVNRPYQNIQKWAVHAKKVITISEFNKKYMSREFNIPSDKIEVVTCSKYLDTLEPVQEYTRSPFRIISVSRLVEKKGYPYLIQACKILKDRGIAFSCTIHGEGEERPLLEKLIQENRLEYDIRLGVALTHDEVITFMKTGSVFVLPCIRTDNNDMDGLPNVLLESMVMEIPTISTNISGIPELIEDGVNGIIVPQKDPLALAEAIIKVRDNPNFTERIRKKGKERVLQAFDVNKNVRKLVEIFER